MSRSRKRVRKTRSGNNKKRKEFWLEVTSATISDLLVEFVRYVIEILFG